MRLETSARLALVVLASSLPMGRAEAKRDCSGLLNTKDEVALLGRIDEIHRDYFEGRIDLGLRTEKLQALVTGDGSNPARSALLTGMVASAGEARAAEFLIPVLTRLLAGRSPDAEELATLAGLGLPAEVPLTEYLDESAELLRPAYDDLIAAGVVYDVEEGWDFGKLDLRDFLKDAERKDALRAFFPASLIERLEDVRRTEAVIFGPLAFLPPSRRHQGRVRAISYDVYEASVSRWLVAYQQQRISFLEASKSANTYRNLVGGARRGRNEAKGIRGFFQPELSASPQQIEANGAEAAMRKTIEELRWELGIPGDMYKDLLKLGIDDIRQASHYTDKGLKRIKGAKVAVYASFATPIVLYAVPAAASALGFAMFQNVASSGLLFFTGVGMDILTSAVIDTVRSRGHFFCNLSEAYYDKAPKSLVMAPFLSLIPTGDLVGKELATKGAKKVATRFATKSGRRLILRIGGVRLVAALVLFKTAVEEKVKGAPECEKIVKQAIDDIEMEREQVAQKAIKDASFKGCAKVLLRMGKARLFQRDAT